MLMIHTLKDCTLDVFPNLQFRTGPGITAKGSRFALDVTNETKFFLSSNWNK